MGGTVKRELDQWAYWENQFARDALAALTLDVLKGRCWNQGLPTEGTKAELIDRLRADSHGR